MAEARPALEMRGISKTFPGVKALAGVKLTAHAGEVLALMGENGAGKSTLMKILSGAHRADPDGEILIDGTPVAITGPQAARALGIAIIYQELALAPNLTVAENIYLGDEMQGRFGRIDRRAMSNACRPVLERLGTSFGTETLVGTLSIAEQQLVEIARALHRRSRILVLDEPTTALLGPRDGQALRDHPQASRGRYRADLYQPPHGRSLRARRSRHGSPGRHLCRHALARRAVGRGDRQADGRPRPVLLLHVGA